MDSTCPNCHRPASSGLFTTPPIGPDGAGVKHCGCFYIGDGAGVEYHTSRDPFYDAEAVQQSEARVATLVAKFGELTPQNREEAMSRLRARFCLACGSDDPRCQCQNDE